MPTTVASTATPTACSSAVIARSFARIFFRNAINIGLLVVEVEQHTIQPGDRISVDVENGLVTNHTSGESYPTTRMPPVMQDILRAGGLVNYLLRHGDYVG